MVHSGREQFLDKERSMFTVNIKKAMLLWPTSGKIQSPVSQHVNLPSLRKKNQSKAIDLITLNVNLKDVCQWISGS